MGGFIKNSKWVENSLQCLNIDYRTESFSEESEERIVREKAIDYFLTYFQAIGYRKDEVEKTIIDYINNHVSDGYLIEKHKINTKLIYFKK